jgi:hypothetical protein
VYILHCGASARRYRPTNQPTGGRGGRGCCPSLTSPTSLVSPAAASSGLAAALTLPDAQSPVTNRLRSVRSESRLPTTTLPKLPACSLPSALLRLLAGNSRDKLTRLVSIPAAGRNGGTRSLPEHHKCDGAATQMHQVQIRDPAGRQMATLLKTYTLLSCTSVFQEAQTQAMSRLSCHLTVMRYSTA